MIGAGVVRIPTSPAALERAWRAFPFWAVLAWAAAGQYPTLDGALNQLETDASIDP